MRNKFRNPISDSRDKIRFTKIKIIHHIMCVRLRRHKFNVPVVSVQLVLDFHFLAGVFATVGNTSFGHVSVSRTRP